MIKKACTNKWGRAGSGGRRGTSVGGGGQKLSIVMVMTNMMVLQEGTAKKSKSLKLGKGHG